MKAFSDRLQQIKRDRGITQKQMAEMTGIAQNTLSAYVRNAKTPSLDIALQIAKGLEVSLDWLCGEDNYRSGCIQTYADLFHSLVEVIEAPLIDDFILRPTVTFDVAGDEIATNDLASADKIVASFLIDYEKLQKLLHDQTIDHEVFQAWLEKRYRDFEHVLLPIPKIISMNAEDNGINDSKED